MANQCASVNVNGIAATVDLRIGTATLARGDVKWSGRAGWIDGVRIGPRPYGEDPCAVFEEADVCAAEIALSAAL